MIVVQLFPKYQVQPISASLAPWLMIILLVSYKEGTQDYSRYTKDLIVNSQKYVIYRNIKGKLERIEIPASEIKVGDLIIITKNTRIPADLVLLKSYKNREVFIRTDQLDGETDWKIRTSPANTESMEFEFFNNEI